MKVAVDFDDVLIQTGINFISYHNKKYGTKIPPEKFYDSKFLLSYGLTRKQMLERIIEYYNKNEVLKMKPSEGAREVLEELRSSHELIVVTGRPKDMTEKTKKMIDENFPGIFSDFVSTDVHRINGGKNKGEICQDSGADILIDDYLGFAKECSDLGIKALLFSQPWNVNEKIESSLITRVDSWFEVKNQI